MRVIYYGEDGEHITVNHLVLRAGVPSADMPEKRALRLISAKHLKIHEYTEVAAVTEPNDEPTTEQENES